LRVALTASLSSYNVLSSSLPLRMIIVYYFFFQAEDGIRDRNVTGVQTCALPISAINLILIFTMLFLSTTDYTSLTKGLQLIVFMLSVYLLFTYSKKSRRKK